MQDSPESVTRRKDPVATRAAILNAAFSEIHLHGFQAASLDSILAEAGVTKGAMYYHFANKLELGYAVVDELIAPHLAGIWALREDDTDAVAAITSRLACMAADSGVEICLKGCPLNNLMQEMSPVDEGFRTRLQAIIDRWAVQLERIIQQGMDRDQLRRDLSAREVALFIIASIEGAAGLAKNAQSYAPLDSWRRCLQAFLAGLRR